MHVVRQLWWLAALIIALALNGCSLMTTAQPAALPVSETHRANTPDAVTPTALAAQSPAAEAAPKHLLIPALGINAFIEAVGTLPNGDMATPTQSPWEHVGWYDAGPRPGEQGSAVIDGHLDRPGGYPAVFWRLRELRVGDEVLVVKSNGKKLTFYVTRVAFYTPQAAPIQDIFGNSAGTYLNLITCAGDWIPSEHQTTLRLVVFTVLA
jgi:sortase (surface protein transpeptidase)